MQYKSTFTNWYVRLNVSTNSRKIRRLVNNYLDFKRNTRARPRIKIDFYLKEVNFKYPEDNRNFIYDRWLSRDVFYENILTMTADYRKRKIRATIINYKDALKERILDLVFNKPLRTILAYRGLFFLHASLVKKGDECILINGPQYSGKSTLALALMRSGFNFLADDDCFIKEDRSVKGQARVLPFTTKMGLSKNTLRKYPEFKKLMVKDYCYGNKPRVSLKGISKFNNPEGYKCRIVLFSRYAPKEKARLKKISKETALSRLSGKDISEKKLTDESFVKTHLFWVFYNLIDKAQAFEITYNDSQLDKAAILIQRAF